jgi:uncharacterized protein YndB with AHSA1/START domain
MWGGRCARLFEGEKESLMSATVVTPDQDAVVSEIDISAPPERVFKALTDAGDLSRWFTGPSCPPKYWKMDARVGGHYAYATNDGSVVGNAMSGFECHGEILECDPPRLLVYSWISNGHEDPSIGTLVRWELAKKGSGTHLKVTHSGLANLPAARKNYSGGWTGVVEKLKRFVEV